MMNETIMFQTTEAVVSQLNTFVASKTSCLLSELNPQTSALVIVDMVNGFVKEGALSSPNALRIVPQIASLLEKSNESNRSVIAFLDEHPADHPEFSTYPPHCIRGTVESEMISELSSIGGYLPIPKNSTNGFLTAAFQSWLQANPQITTFIVVGTCTDICVEQFALSLKTHFNEHNKACRLIVPMDSVATFDAPHHPANLMNALSLVRLEAAGIEIIKSFLD